MRLLSIIKSIIYRLKPGKESKPIVSKIVTKDSITYTIIIKRNNKP